MGLIVRAADALSLNAPVHSSFHDNDDAAFSPCQRLFTNTINVSFNLPRPIEVDSKALLGSVGTDS